MCLPECPHSVPSSHGELRGGPDPHIWGRNNGFWQPPHIGIHFNRPHPFNMNYPLASIPELLTCTCHILLISIYFDIGQNIDIICENVAIDEYLALTIEDKYIIIFINCKNN